MKYLLDTNICIYAINQRSPQIIERMKQEGAKNLTTSALVAAELAFGMEKSTRPGTRAHLEAFLKGLNVLPWGESALWHWARNRHRLQKAGTPVGEIDLLIAAQALGDDLILVTNNTREFERVQGLKLENWAA